MVFVVDYIVDVVRYMVSFVDYMGNVARCIADIACTQETSRTT